MSSPNPDHPGWTNQHYQQPSAQYQDNHYSQGHPSGHSHYQQQAAAPVPYMQPHYGTTSQHFLAELPAPLPPAPPTATSEEQLKQDERLAHRLYNLEVAEVRQRSSSAASQQQRPISMAPVVTQGTPAPLLHQTSTLSLRPQSTNLSSGSTRWRSRSFGAAANGPAPSTLPEVVVAPRTVDPSHDMPIPVDLDRNTSSIPPMVRVLDPSHDLPIPVNLDRHAPSLLPPLRAGTTLSGYLEEHRQVPYPPSWRLPPIIATFYAYAGSKIASGSDWLSQQESFTWRTLRPTEHAYNPAAPSYSFKFATRGGSFRDPKFSWFMTTPELAAELNKKALKRKPTSWTYDLRLHLNSGMRKTEVLGHGRDRAILTTYVHAQNYDSLRFIAPDGRAYMWVSSGTVSSCNGSRYDTIRHALFGATGHIADPLYGEIVADHTFWDGFVDANEVHMGLKCDGCRSKPINGLRWSCRTCHQHDVCEACRKSVISGGFGATMQKSCDFSLVCLPDEALYIRSPTVDTALVVATLQVLKDWARHTLRDEKRKNIKGFLASEDAARRGDLGIMSYWKAEDWDKKNKMNEKVGTVVKAKSTMAAFEGTASAVGGLVDAGFALAGYGTHGGHGGGGGSSGHGGRGDGGVGGEGGGGGGT